MLSNALRTVLMVTLVRGLNCTVTVQLWPGASVVCAVPIWAVFRSDRIREQPGDGVIQRASSTERSLRDVGDRHVPRIGEREGLSRIQRARKNLRESLCLGSLRACDGLQVSGEKAALENRGSSYSRQFHRPDVAVRTLRPGCAEEVILGSRGGHWPC